MFPPHVTDEMRSLWLDFGDDPEPSNRDRLVYLTMREVAIVGPASFNTAGVCDTLGISYPMVNYYFGNRDGLIAEAGHATYVRYIAKLWAAVEDAPRTPIDRLRAWMQAHLRLNVEIRGWGAVLNYPRFSSSMEEILDERFGEDHRRNFELNMARLARLILDVWEEDAALVVGELERGDRGPHEAWVQRDLRERHASGGANAFDHRGCDDRTEDREEQPVLLGLRERFDERPVEQASRGVRLGEDRERGR
ncbi:MAG: TetR/AcrR family transcriptional regulator [Actinomycetota bacterium]|nr:TetR/AcrR family transcriptional regulator [Actinomycetota bacterium]